MDQLIYFIKTKTDIENSDLENILFKFKQKNVLKGKLLLKSSQIATKYYFLASGELSFFYGDYADQLTAWIVLPGEFFTDISNLNPKFQPGLKLRQ